MDTTQELQPYQKELLLFDPIVILRDVLRRWALILSAAIIVGIAAFVISDSGYRPVYRSNATLLVTSRSSYATVYDNVNSASELATVFSKVMNSSVLREKVLEQAKLESFNGRISANVISNTNLMTLQVQGGDPRSVFLVMEAILENHEMITYSVMGDVVIEVLQAPKVPVAPSNTANPQKAMKLAMVVTAAGLCALFALLSYRRDTVRSRKEATKKLNCWCLGEILHERKCKTPKDYFRRKKQSILITRPETGFHYVTAINKLTHRIIKLLKGRKVILVTSVMEDEGKSTVVTNIALRLAKKHNRVLLIDCDLRRPSVQKVLELDRAKRTVNDVLSGKCTLQEAVTKERLYGLHVLPAAKFSPREAEKFIHSQAMRQMLLQARGLYDYVLIDLPPMGVASDTECIMDLADASVLVVRQNISRAPAINRAIATLQTGKAELLGCVLNNVHVTYLTTGEGYEAGYGRYGRYGRYGHYGKYGRYNRYAARDEQSV